MSVGLVVLQDDERGGVRYIQAYARSEEVVEAGMKYWLPLEVAMGDDWTIEDKGKAYLNAFIKALQEKHEIPSHRQPQRHPEIDDRAGDLVGAGPLPQRRNRQGEVDDRGLILQQRQTAIAVNVDRDTRFSPPKSGLSEIKKSGLPERKWSQKKRKDEVTISFSWKCNDLPLNGAFCNVNLTENGDLLTISADLPMFELEDNPQMWDMPSYSPEELLEEVRKVDPEWDGENPSDRLWYFSRKKEEWRLAYLVKGVFDRSKNDNPGKHGMMNFPEIMDLVIDAESNKVVTASQRSWVF
jgi:hypothetical protein